MLTEQEKINIREAKITDVDAITILLGELGYPPTDSKFASNNISRLSGPLDRIFVAEVDGSVIGLISIHLLPMLHAPGFLGKVTGLVVAPSSRGKGVGKSLLKAAESFAFANAAWRIEIISGNHRPEAHCFYQHMGYRPTNQTRFLLEV